MQELPEHINKQYEFMKQFLDHGAMKEIKNGQILWRTSLKYAKSLNDLRNANFANWGYGAEARGNMNYYKDVACLLTGKKCPTIV